MTALSLTSISDILINPIFYEFRFKRSAIEALTKIFQESFGKTSETTITHKSKLFTVSIAAVILSSESDNHTYSLWDYSKEAHDYFKTADPPITEVKIIAIACQNIFIQIGHYNPFEGAPTPYRYKI